MKGIFRSTLLTWLLLVCAAPSTAAPLESAFSFQGLLDDSGQPADGAYDLTFSLFGQNAGGNAVAGPITLDDVPVAGGVFAVALDFGIAPFAGDQLWVEIGVRTGAETGAFTTLAPRQPLRAVPYALHAEFVGAGVVGPDELAPGAVGEGQIDTSEVQARVEGICAPGSAIRSIGANGVVGCQSVDDGDWADAGSLLTTARGVGIGGATDNVGSGTLTVQDYDNFSIDGFGGMYVDVARSVNEIPFYGYAVDGTPRAFTEFNEGSDQFRIWNGAYGLVLDRLQRTGLNVASPVRTLHVGGDARIEALAHGGSGKVAVFAEPDGDLVLEASDGLLFYSLSPWAFQPHDSTRGEVVRDGNFAHFQPGLGLPLVDPLERTLAAPLNLPDGATIESIEVFAAVDVGESGFFFGFDRTRVSDGSATVSVAAEVFGQATGNVESFAILEFDEPVDNRNFAYSFWVAARGSEEKIRSVRIAYTR